MKKFYTLVFLFACFSFHAFAQPANDTPCSANLIAVDGGFVLDSTFDATVDPNEVLVEGIQGPLSCYVSWCDGPVLDGSVWWTFVAPGNGAVEITTCSENTDFDTQIALWSASDCADYSTYGYVASNDDMPEQCDSGGSVWASTLNVDGLTPGETYYVQLDGFEAAFGYYEIAVSTGVPATRINFVHNSGDLTIPVVDIRMNNELVADDLGFQTCTGFIDVMAGSEIFIAICDPESTDDTNPLYSFTADISDVENYVAIIHGIYAEAGYTPSVPLQLALFEGALENPTLPDFHDVLFFHGSTDAPTVDVEAIDLGNQTILNNSSSGNYASEGYIQVGTMNYSLELNDENGNSLGLIYCAPFGMLGGNYALTVVASGFLDPSQNSDGSPFGVYVVDHFNGGFIPLEVGPCPVAPNDFPCDAIELIVNDPPYESNNTWASIDENEVSPPNLDFNDPEADCATQWCDGALNNSVWFKFTAPASGEVRISTCHPITIDTQVALYSVTSCGDYSTFTYIAANDDAEGGCTEGNNYASILDVNGLTSGALYYVQVDGWGGENGDFEITVEDVVSVQEADQTTWTMYPNPADNVVQFTGLRTGALIQFYDVTGKLVKSTAYNQQNPVDLTDLAAGVYSLQIVQSGKFSNGKLIIE